MATQKQQLGERGEVLVTKKCACPKCKRAGTLKRLRTNFKCADLICDFCGYLAQVKTKTSADISRLPKTIPGAAWGVQKDRMDSAIYFPLFIVLVKEPRKFAIYYLPADIQFPEMFIPRKPLSTTAKRPGWQGFNYDLSGIDHGGIVRLK